jgi:hypothetical protein
MSIRVELLQSVKDFEGPVTVFHMESLSTLACLHKAC